MGPETSHMLMEMAKQTAVISGRHRRPCDDEPLDAAHAPVRTEVAEVLSQEQDGEHIIPRGYYGDIDDMSGLHVLEVSAHVQQSACVATLLERLGKKTQLTLESLAKEGLITTNSPGELTDGDFALIDFLTRPGLLRQYIDHNIFPSSFTFYQINQETVDFLKRVEHLKAGLRIHDLDQLQDCLLLLKAGGYLSHSLITDLTDDEARMMIDLYVQHRYDSNTECDNPFNALMNGKHVNNLLSSLRKG